MSIDYKDILNESQYEAVTTIDGPLLVIAGAGSGKTRTLVYRVANLVQSGIEPESVLLLTFTRKASFEMLERAAGLSDTKCRFVSGGTFHSIAHKALRNNAKRIGYEPTFTILDRSDMEEVVGTVLSDLGISSKTPRFPQKTTIATILSKAANMTDVFENYMLNEYPQFVEFLKEIKNIYSEYTLYKKKHHMMDYDDLMLNFRLLLQEHEDIRKNLADKYRYLMVDEYQDTNTIQSEIIFLIGGIHRNVMVVGDDSQAIYSFRGANHRNMFLFQDAFPETKFIKLEKNYRSVQPILTFTNELMAGAREKYTKCLLSVREEEANKPSLVDTGSELEQARFVCRKIIEFTGQGYSFQDIAVLFRAGYHSFELEAELTRQRIQYVKYGGFKFLESSHIKDFLSHLRVAVNKNDVIAWSRILGLVKNIGKVKSNRIIDWILSEGKTIIDIRKWPGFKPADEGLVKLGELLESIDSVSSNPYDAVKITLDYYYPTLRDTYDDYPRRQTELDQLLFMAERHRSLRSFIDDLILDPPSNQTEITGRTIEGKPLTLSTIHSAKGLEWPIVFIIWLADGKFPPAQAYSSPDSMEEERRLLYVAATRAKDHLIMCYPGMTGQSYGNFYSNNYERVRGGTSCLITGIPDSVIDRKTSSRITKVTNITSGWSESYFKSQALADIKNYDNGDDGVNDGESTKKSEYKYSFKKGDKVMHPAFGDGIIARLVGDNKVEILFSKVGKKLLHLEYTNLTKK